MSNFEWRNPLTYVMFVIAVAVLFLVIPRCIVSFNRVDLEEDVSLIKIRLDNLSKQLEKISSKGSGPINIDNRFSSFESKMDYIEKTISQTREDVVTVCEDTVSASRDIITLITIAIGLVSVAVLVKIGSIKEELITNIRKETDVYIREIIEKELQYFDRLRQLIVANPNKVRSAIDFFMTFHEKYADDPYVINQFKQALAKAESESDHHNAALLLRVLVLIGYNEAIDNLIVNYRRIDITQEDKKQYKIALKGLVAENNNLVANRLRKEPTLFDEIMGIAQQN
jgi:tetrahydromethanopterin S-methyltransferase subunit G